MDGAANTDDPGPPVSPRPRLVTGFGSGSSGCGSPLITGLLLLIPPFGCPTGPVYGAFDARPTHTVDEAGAAVDRVGARPIRRPRPGAVVQRFGRGGVRLVEPRLSEVLDKLRGLSPHMVHVTGSGSTMFVIPDPSSPIALADPLGEGRSAGPGTGH